MLKIREETTTFIMENKIIMAKKPQGQKVTVYQKSEFMGNILKVEGRLPTEDEISRMGRVEKAFGFKKWAQYNSVPFAVVKPKRKQLFRQMQSSGFRPFMLIVDGWDAPNPDSLYGKPEVDENGTGFAKGRHSGFDEGWTKDFGQTISTYLTANPEKILMDDRGREYASMEME